MVAGRVPDFTEAGLTPIAHAQRVARPQRGSLRRALLITLALGWTLAPLLPLLPLSLSAGWRWPDLLPQAYDLRTWSYLFSPGARAGAALLSSMLIAGLVTLLALLLGLPAAFAIGRLRFGGRAVAEALIVAPLIVPPLTVAMGLQVIFIWLGLTDSVLGVVLTHLIFSLPYVVLILASAYAALGPEWEQQARSLGATPLRAFAFVTLPLLRPSLAVAALLAFLVSWSQYGLTLLIGGSEVFTLPILVFSLARGSDLALAAAAALLFVAPTIIVLAIAGRNLEARDGGLGLL